MPTAKTKYKTTRKWRTQPSLSAFLAAHGVRYKWLDNGWPAIPVKLGADDPTPRRTPTEVTLLVGKSSQDCKEQTIEVLPDAPPQWVQRIHERFFEKVLSFKNSKSLKDIAFLDAAIYGFIHAANSVPRIGKKYEALPTTKDSVQVNRRKMHRAQSEEEERKHQEFARGVCERRLADVKATGTPTEAAAYQKGFDYGAECQQKEEAEPRSHSVEKVQIYKALVETYQEVESLIRQNATSRVIGQYVAEHAFRDDLRPQRPTWAEFFEKHPPRGDEVALPSGELISTLCGQGRQRAARLSAEGRFLKLFEKVCVEVGIQLPPPGRPAEKTRRVEA
jgi:hypothetical protein